MNTGGYDPASQLAGSNNNFVINIPSLGVGNAYGNGSGLALNFDMGASPSAIASQAYSFLNQSFSTDQGFLNQAISGTQNFLSHQISPILVADAAQINQNAGYIPKLYSSLQTTGQAAIGAIQANTAAGVAAQQAETVASINASANAGGGGGCYITTAVCESLGMRDDCEILQTLRKFRDEYCGGKPGLKVYYATAPRIVSAINARTDSRECYRQLLRRYILPACHMIQAGCNDSAYRIYRAGCTRAAHYAQGSK